MVGNTIHLQSVHCRKHPSICPLIYYEILMSFPVLYHFYLCRMNMQSFLLLHQEYNEYTDMQQLVTPDGREFLYDANNTTN
jgi:hypothetical protein